MKYGITTFVAGSPGFVDINEEEYIRIRCAIGNLLEILFLEEKLDLVTENFLEYETELLSIASHFMVFQDEDYLSMSREKNTVCRRIVNLLTACRMYLEQCVHHKKNIYGANSENVNLLKQEIASQYDQHYGYRIMEALRNYTQHRGVPIHSILFSREWLDFESKEDSRLHYVVVPTVRVSELSNDEKFKKAVVNEMLSTSKKDDIDIRPFIRNYIECIGNIHEKARVLTHPDVENWENIIYDSIKRVQNEFGAEISLAGLAIVAREDESHWIERKPIHKIIIDRRQALENKNRLFVNLHKRFASNEIRIKDK